VHWAQGLCPAKPPVDDAEHRHCGSRLQTGPKALAAGGFISVGLPVLASVMIAISAVLSLVTIISIYPEECLRLNFLEAID
jgi:hypothetical protein